MKRKSIVDKVLAKAAYSSAKINVNSNCKWFYYQAEVPKKVKELKNVKH